MSIMILRKKSAVRLALNAFIAIVLSAEWIYSCFDKAVPCFRKDLLLSLLRLNILCIAFHF